MVDAGWTGKQTFTPRPAIPAALSVAPAPSPAHRASTPEPGGSDEDRTPHRRRAHRARLRHAGARLRGPEARHRLGREGLVEAAAGQRREDEGQGGGEDRDGDAVAAPPAYVLER